MPGVAELQSLATLEAMASGAAVAAADDCAAAHGGRGGRQRLAVPAGRRRGRSPTGSAWRSMTPAGARRMGRHSRLLAERHDLGATLDTFEDLYERVLGRAGVAADRAA